MFAGHLVSNPLGLKGFDWAKLLRRAQPLGALRTVRPLGFFTGFVLAAAKRIGPAGILIGCDGNALQFDRWCGRNAQG